MPLILRVVTGLVWLHSHMIAGERALLLASHAYMLLIERHGLHRCCTFMNGSGLVCLVGVLHLQ
jgi:hypothetical protein